MRILPPSIACLASARVLKNRAAHSHTSRRTLFAADGLDPVGVEVLINAVSQGMSRQPNSSTRRAFAVDAASRTPLSAS
jgi:hypothetical protein